MRLALVQVRPEFRLLKLARGLAPLAHEVMVVSVSRTRPRSEHAWLAAGLPHVWVESGEGVEALAPSVDLVVHFDQTQELALAGSGHPGFVQFVGDLSGAREDAERSSALEGACLRAARGQIFVSEAQAELASELYGPFTCPAVAVHNGPVEEMLGGTEAVSKLSDADGRTHVVYSGLIAREPGGSRDVVPLVDRLLEEDDLVVHVIPAAGKKIPERLTTRAGTHERLVVEPTVASRELAGSLARFDVGLVYVDDAFQRIRDTMRPNKLYEYLAAGLPVVANRGRSLEEYLSEKRAGLVFDRLDDAAGAVRRALALPREPGWPPAVETYESQAGRLEDFFGAVLARGGPIRG